MSGGGLGDCGPYMVEDWAGGIRPHNPVLADMMDDMYEVLTAYDHWLAGDCGADKVETEWGAFRDRWLDRDGPQVEGSLRQAMEGIIRSWRTGHTREEW